MEGGNGAMEFENWDVSQGSFNASIGPIDVRVSSGGGVFGDLMMAIT